MDSGMNIKNKGLVGFLKTNYKTLFDIFFTVLFMGLGLYTLIYYLTGPALGYFHSDCSDSLLWSQVIIDSGKILSDDFYYAAILPFGSPVYMVPILKIFGYTMKAQIISTCVFAVIFIFSALSMFRAMKWKYSVSAFASFCLCMLLSGSVKLREIMWEHVIYYSLGILFLMLALNLTFRLLDKLENIKEGTLKDKILSVIYSVLLLLLCAGIATDGFQLLALTAVPVSAALVAVVIFDGKTKLASFSVLKKCSVCALMGIGAVIGTVILDRLTNGGEIAAGYANRYSSWSAMSAWVGNFEKFPQGWFSLFGVSVEKGEILFSGKSISVLLMLLCAVVLFVCPFVLLGFYKRINKYERMIAWSHIVVLGVTMVGYVCGGLSNANWRLTPLLGSSIIATMALAGHLCSIKLAPRRVGALLAVFLFAISVFNANTIFSMDRNFGKDDPLQKVADTLEERGYTRGYATFWNASEVTLRSNSAVNVITYEIVDNKMIETHYQTMDSWFEDVEGQEDYFVIFTQNEYNTVGGQEHVENFGVQVIDRIDIEGYIILICDGNIFR